MGDLPFSNAVIVGNTVYLAGHIGLEPGTRENCRTTSNRKPNSCCDVAVRDTLTRSGSP